MAPTIELSHNEVEPDGAVGLVLDDVRGVTSFQKVEWSVVDHARNDAGVIADKSKPVTEWRAIDVDPTVVTVNARVRVQGKWEAAVEPKAIRVRAPMKVTLENPPASPVAVDMQPPAIPDTADLPLWEVIKLGSEALSFENYKAFMDFLFCNADIPDALVIKREASGKPTKLTEIGDRWEADKTAVNSEYQDSGGFAADLPFPDIHSYRVLKAATEAFLMVNCEVSFEEPNFPKPRTFTPQLRKRLGLEPGASLKKLWESYLEENGTKLIPYLHAVQANVADIQLTDNVKEAELCNAILREKLTNPCLLELIWSYWHEEGMLVQTMNAICMRFQNRRGRAPVDPLANLAIDPLRPLGNLLWGYIQDEQHRLTLARRVYEYDHEYGLTLLGQAVPQVYGADTRSRFLEAFHNLLHRASIFYKEDDDATMIADAFPVLNALRDVHLLLAEGAHNQWRDLPWTARQEMLMQQWILARSEFREFLPSRVMVPYPEPWMQRVEAMRRLQGWGDTSVRYFRDLGVFGEQIVLSIRFGNWSEVFDRDQAGNWARFWRQEVAWYIHAYQAVTGVDLSADISDVRAAEQARERSLQPAVHLQRRLVEQRTRTPQTAYGAARPAAPQPTASQPIHTS
jgi:hypothetical protein